MPHTYTPVDRALDAFPASHQPHAHQLRDTIRSVAEHLDLGGEVVETLKWGQPSWLPPKRGVGTTVRVAVHDDATIGLYVPCSTTLIGQFRITFGEQLTYSGDRAVLFDVNEPLPLDTVRHCVRTALTYHRDKPS